MLLIVVLYTQLHEQIGELQELKARCRDLGVRNYQRDRDTAREHRADTIGQAQRIMANSARAKNDMMEELENLKVRSKAAFAALPWLWYEGNAMPCGTTGWVMVWTGNCH